jgi:bifunctional non-homologous end joining protein LigD
MSTINTSLDGVHVKLSNLDKVLWPEDGVTKAHLIQYYLSVWPYIQQWCSARPLTLIRYPDGIHGNKFYSKNAADHTPTWLPQILMEDISYLYIHKSADLIYMANLAALELHAMTVAVPQVDRPDTIIFDLDPSPDITWEQLKSICDQLYQFIAAQGYHPHIKTSGSKGLHIYVPILSQYTREQVFNAAKTIGQEFVQRHPETTVRMSKDRRQGKVLIDIYRNHDGQTCVMPLSTRARLGVSVSMPILYKHLHSLSGSDQYHIHNALDYLEQHKPWQHFRDLAMPIVGIEVPTASLERYTAKRDFSKTTEPSTNIVPETSTLGSGHRFVIQKHDASNLHYDLRLEENGVLTSWAIPKSIPSLPQIKRLAIRTEDHPLPYLTFEGDIPAHEYGGGRMWIFDTGTYQMVKKSENAYRIILEGKYIRGEYTLVHTQDSQWIIERKSPENATWPQKIAGPMLAEQVMKIPSSGQYFFELKWDGIRVTVLKRGPKVTILSKSGRDITPSFMDVVTPLEDFDAEEAILDGELVSLDGKGVPVFAHIISRMHSKSASTIASSARAYPATLYLFDLRYIDGRSCTREPIERRRDWLAASLKVSERVRLSELFDDGESLFEGAKALGLEGIMAKKYGSLYTEEKRSLDWVKIKVRALIDVVIIGYTRGNGDRSELYGAIHVAIREGQTLKYMGKVGTGWDEAKMKEVSALLKEVAIIDKPIPDNIEEASLTTWIKPILECEVQYASLTPNGTLREPVFFRMKEGE